MASLRPLDQLPDEILLHILRYLEPRSIPKLRLVSRRLNGVCLDNKLWKRHCFDHSSWYRFLQNRRGLYNTSSGSDHDYQDLNNLPDDSRRPRTERSRMLQDMANWDPVFPDERISWYDEYIQRHGPTSVSWLQTPRFRIGGSEMPIEARGLALYTPNNGDDGAGSMLAVSPLDDGSVCLWDVSGSRGKRGGIVTKSRPGILFAHGPGNQDTKRSKRIDTGVTECVSVNNNSHRAFFAVQSHLLEVDLNRLEVVSRESFEWSITTLSQIHDGVPLTVGTSLGVHLHDFRSRARVPRQIIEQLDGPGTDLGNPFSVIFDTRPLPPYASLSQPTPISILHLPRSGNPDLVSDDIYVAGRFSNILHYDRRKFPSIVNSIYSGARLSSLAALPYSFSAVDYEVRRYGQMSATEVKESKTKSDGRTLIAGGEYKTKGSLELYGLGQTKHSVDGAVAGNSTMKNRHTAASSIILSVINHGNKIVFSDGAGLVKLFERDGSTECRRIKIGHSEAQTASSLFASMPGSDDLARKILSTKSKQGHDRLNEDNVVFWTGEKLGLLSFTQDPLFKAEDFEVQDQKTTADEEARQMYTQEMREALERQADDVRFVRGLGLGRAAGS
ncbi:hypothetical protein G7046_g3225 [Stylonectria norvegica]|nr:hypothetical protein G7046_g3225 [Stylonectria norvegica]